MARRSPYSKGLPAQPLGSARRVRHLVPAGAVRILVVIDKPAAVARAVGAAVSFWEGTGGVITLLGTSPEPVALAAQTVSLEALSAEILQSVDRWLQTAIAAVPGQVPVRSRAILGRLGPTIRRVLDQDPHDLVVVCARQRGWLGQFASWRFERLSRRCGVPIITTPLDGGPVGHLSEAETVVSLGERRAHAR
jgi:hypothetical protein